MVSLQLKDLGHQKDDTINLANATFVVRKISLKAFCDCRCEKY